MKDNEGENSFANTGTVNYNKDLIIGNCSILVIMIVCLKTFGQYMANISINRAVHMIRATMQKDIPER